MMDGRYILVSVHDVTPFYERQTRRIIDELEHRKMKYSILIIPKLNDRFNTSKEYNILDYPQFIRFLKKSCGELILHGLDHADAKYIDDPRQVEQRIKIAIKIFREAFNKKPRGYTPPRWVTNKEQNNILKKYFDYTEGFYGIRLFNKRFIFGFPLGMESMMDNEHFKKDKITPALIKYLSLIYSKIHYGNVIRLTIHAREVDIDGLEHSLSLLDNYLKNGWTPITYSELNKKI